MNTENSNETDDPILTTKEIVELAILNGNKLHNKDFSYFNQANLYSANFSFSNLESTNFNKSNLNQATLTSANLSKAFLKEAKLTGAILTRIITL